MKYASLVPLTRPARILRAVLLVALIVGNLFPPIGGVSIALVATLLTVPTVVYEVLRWLPRLHPVLAFVLPVFGAVTLHMLIVQPETDYGHDKMIKWVTITFLTALAASLIRDERALSAFATTWVVAALGLSVVAIAGFTGGRAVGFESNPIWLARAIATALVMLLWFATQRQVRLQWAVPGALILIVGLLSTGSRGPIVAVGVGAIAVVLFTQRHRIRNIATICISAAAAYLAIRDLPFFADSRLVTLLQEGDTDYSRGIFWQNTPGVIRAHPSGVGTGNWMLYAEAPRQFEYPHNLFLETFAELGVIIGGALVLTLLVMLWKLAKLARQEPIAILVLALLSAETANVSLSGDLNARTFWFMLTLGFLVVANAVLPVVASREATTGTPVSSWPTEAQPSVHSPQPPAR